MKRRKIARAQAVEGFLNLNAEKAEATKKSRFEKLNVNMVELQHGPKADFLRQACDILTVGGNEVDSESKKMLAVSISPNGAVSFFCSVPARKAESLIALLEEFQAMEEISVDRVEVSK